MGDRWRSDILVRRSYRFHADIGVTEMVQGTSTYIWYPLDFSSGSPQIVHADVWNVNLAAGVCVISASYDDH